MCSTLLQHLQTCRLFELFYLTAEQPLPLVLTTAARTTACQKKNPKKSCTAPNAVSKKSAGWNKVSKGGDTPGTRRGAAVAVTSNDLLIVQGGKPFDNDLECDSHTYALDLNALSSSTRQWEQKAPLPVECRYWCATLCLLLCLYAQRSVHLAAVLQHYICVAEALLLSTAALLHYKFVLYAAARCGCCMITLVT
jgi:hypothetical protein